jgi:MtN3 and saliva related transmembrane protein
MTTTETLGIAALVAGILMALSPTLQVRRMLQTRSSRDYSLGYPSLLCAGFVFWLAYGISLVNWPMILSNIASLAFMLSTIVVALYFRRVEGAATVQAPDAIRGG